MKLPDGLINIIYWSEAAYTHPDRNESVGVSSFYGHGWIGHLPDVVSFLREHQADNDYYLEEGLQVAESVTCCRLWRSKEQHDAFKQRVQEIKEKHQLEIENKKKEIANPIIIKLRDAIAGERWQEVLEITQMMRSAGGYDKELRQVNLKQLMNK